LEEGLAHLFGRPVDLVSRRALRNKYFIDAVNASKVTLYEA
jgi:predicted nucleotidyltransferase